MGTVSAVRDHDPLAEPLRRPDSDPPERLWRQTSWLLHQAAARANRVVGEHFGRSGGRIRYAILSGLDQLGSVSQAELSRRLGIDRSDTVAALNILEKEGLARRRPDRGDARRNLVTISAAGRRMLATLEEQVGQAQEELLAELSVDDRERLDDLLRRLIRYDRADDRTPPQSSSA